MFRDELKDAINAKTKDERLERAGAVRVMEAMISENAFLRPNNFNETIELQNALLQLRELQYLGRYGDYLKIIPGQVRMISSATKFEDWELLSGQRQWTEVAKDLIFEERK